MMQSGSRSADSHLPDMIGDALAAAVKALSSATKVVIITADSAIDGMNQWPNVDVCLIKPFPLHDLVTVVRTLLPSDVRARARTFV